MPRRRSWSTCLNSQTFPFRDSSISQQGRCSHHILCCIPQSISSPSTTHSRATSNRRPGHGLDGEWSLFRSMRGCDAIYPAPAPRGQHGPPHDPTDPCSVIMASRRPAWSWERRDWILFGQRTPLARRIKEGQSFERTESWSAGAAKVADL